MPRRLDKTWRKSSPFWADDALVVPPGQSEKVSFSPDGQLAYMRSTNVTSFTGPDGNPVAIRGRGVTVWRREPDGQWRCTIDIWNEPPGSTPSPR